MNPSPSELLRSRFPEAVLQIHSYRGDHTATVRPQNLLEIARFLKEDPALQMNFLMDLGAVDYLSFGKQTQPRGAFISSGVRVPQPMNVPDEAPWPERATLRQASGQAPDRFEVVYHFFSLPLLHRIRIKVPVSEQHPEVDSIASLWGSADWFEREVWDMFGIRFRGHPNLKRILMYEGFEGHPLRKDYPVNKRQPLIGPVN
jgi:NADH-quinone oxidoreductase subunit C